MKGPNNDTPFDVWAESAHRRLEQRAAQNAARLVHLRRMVVDLKASTGPAEVRQKSREVYLYCLELRRDALLLTADELHLRSMKTAREAELLADEIDAARKDAHRPEVPDYMPEEL